MVKCRSVETNFNPRYYYHLTKPTNNLKFLNLHVSLFTTIFAVAAAAAGLSSYFISRFEPRIRLFDLLMFVLHCNKSSQLILDGQCNCVIEQKKVTNDKINEVWLKTTNKRSQNCYRNMVLHHQQEMCYENLCEPQENFHEMYEHAHKFKWRKRRGNHIVWW